MDDFHRQGDTGGHVVLADLAGNGDGAIPQIDVLNFQHGQFLWSNETVQYELHCQKVMGVVLNAVVMKTHQRIVVDDAAILALLLGKGLDAGRGLLLHIAMLECPLEKVAEPNKVVVSGGDGVSLIYIDVIEKLNESRHLDFVDIDRPVCDPALEHIQV